MPDKNGQEVCLAFMRCLRAPQSNNGGSIFLAILRESNLSFDSATLEATFGVPYATRFPHLDRGVLAPLCLMAAAFGSVLAHSRRMTPIGVFSHGLRLMKQHIDEGNRR